MDKAIIPQAESRSADLIKDNIEQLKQIFPEVIKEGKVDFEALHDLLGEYGDTAEERFCLNWAGKSEARREAQKRSTGTLRPCEEDSVDWDTTENLYIEGDNLEVLKLLQKSYHRKVKMIYIDPPYNTGKDFVYKDNYKDNMANYLELIGEDRKISTKALSDSDGRYHSNWLNMMYPRLKLARNLLAEDGVIFISIDDNEVDNLKKVCNEIFGEDNFVAQLPTIMNLKGNNDEYGFAGTHEYTLVYVKSKVEFTFGQFIIRDENIDKWEEDEYGCYKKGANLKSTGVNAPRSKRPNLFFPLYITEDNRCLIYRENASDEEIFPITDSQEMSWRWDKIKFANEPHNIIISRDGAKVSIYKKQRPNIGELPSKKPKTLFYKPEYSSGNGTQQIKQLFQDKTFTNPKPLDLIKDFLELANDKNSIILDFFSGSATTAHAVIKLNAEDGGNRKFICVQLPEVLDEKSEAVKAKYQNICEIGKERIRRAGENIVEEQKAKNDGLFAGETPKLDIGFRVFKLDSSNINSWDSSPENLEQTLYNSLFNIKEGRGTIDLLYEILIKYGIELSTKVNSHTIAGKTVYEIGAGSLIVCLEEGITTEVAEGIAQLWKAVKPEGVDIPCRVIFKDSGFNGSDEVKSNTLLILKQHGIMNVASV